MSNEHITHSFLSMFIKNGDGTISFPCKECGAELRFIPNGFTNPLDLKFHEPDGLEWILMRENGRSYEKNIQLDKDSLVVDIGAHVGIVSMTLAKKYGCRVIAYEPNPHNYERLVKNI